MALSREYHRGERRLWVGPIAMTGPQLREACILPPLVRIGVPALVGAAVMLISVGMADLDWPFLAALPIFAVLLVGTGMALQACTRDRRRRFGLVQVPTTTFDVLLELAKVAPEAVSEGRRLHDQLVAAVASAGYRDGEVDALEARMDALLAGLPSIPG